MQTETDLPDLDPEDTSPAVLRALELLRRGKRFLLVGHVRPDGDCLGSQAALASVLRSLGKEVFIVNPDPPEPRYGYLAAEVDFRAWQGGTLPVHDVAVLLDFNDLARTGKMAPELARAPSKKLVVDHHVLPTEAWWDEAYVDVHASATGLLVLRIARALGAELDQAAARGVFTSLVTDTGWFKYSNADAETLTAAGEMVRLGVRPHEVYSALYQRRSHVHPTAIGKLLSRTRYFADRRLALVTQPIEEAREEGLVDSDEVLDILRSVATVEVVLYLRELAEGGVKLSARSKSDYDVHALSRAFGGGGHKKAAGATLPGGLAEAEEKVVAAALAGFDARA